MNNDVGEIFRTDAKAEGEDVVIGGWESKGGAKPGESKWFATRLTEQNCPWLHCRGEPFRVIAALELYSTLFGILAFMPEGGGCEGFGLVTGSAITDNRGNAYAVGNMMSTKFPLNVLLMEVSEQLEKRGSWLRVEWAPREQNVHADALTNMELAEFDPQLRVDIDPSTVSWVLLTTMIEAGGNLSKELAEKKAKKKEERTAARRAKRQRKSREDALRVRDPW